MLSGYRFSHSRLGENTTTGALGVFWFLFVFSIHRALLAQQSFQEVMEPNSKLMCQMSKWPFSVALMGWPGKEFARQHCCVAGGHCRLGPGILCPVSLARLSSGLHQKKASW